MTTKTCGQTEAEFTKAVIKFEKEYLGRSLREARTFLNNDMIVVCLRGILTQPKENWSKAQKGKPWKKKLAANYLSPPSPCLKILFVMLSVVALSACIQM